MHPYLDGVTNPRNRTFRVSCFNSRKLSPVFTGGPGADEVPPVWIDRAGFKANVTEVGVVVENDELSFSAIHLYIAVMHTISISELHPTKQIHLWACDGGNHTSR